MTTDSDSKGNRELLDRNIQKTVAVSALRKIRRLIEEYEREKQLEHRLTRVALVIACIVAVGVLIFIGAGRLRQPTTAPPHVAESPRPVERSAAQSKLPETQVPKPDRLRPRTVFVGSRTEDFRVARYLAEWRQHLESFGTEHFPAVVREKRLYGTVVLTTFVRADGTVAEAQVSKTSGHQELDDAAKSLVLRAAPFSKFPDDLLKDVDVLAITRTFSFTTEENPAN
jgi:TonB family protein